MSTHCRSLRSSDFGTSVVAALARPGCWMHLLSKMKAARLGTNKIARDLALTLSESVRPQSFEHPLGLANVVADELSTRHEPSHEFVKPAWYVFQTRKILLGERVFSKDFTSSSRATCRKVGWFQSRCKCDFGRVRRGVMYGGSDFGRVRCGVI